MKTILITLSLLASSVAFSADQPKGLGQFDPQQCGCEKCFTNYGVCTAVNQNSVREEVSRKTASGKKGRGSQVRGL